MVKLDVKTKSSSGVVSKLKPFGYRSKKKKPLTINTCLPVDSHALLTLQLKRFLFCFSFAGVQDFWLIQHRNQQSGW